MLLCADWHGREEMSEQVSRLYAEARKLEGESIVLLEQSKRLVEVADSLFEDDIGKDRESRGKGGE